MDARAPASPAVIYQMLDGAQVTGVLAAAIQLGMFGHLDAGPRDAAGLAGAIGAPERSTRILLEAMVAVGLLERQGEQYRLTPLSRAYLVPGKPGYVGDIAGIQASPWMWAGLARLAEAVKNGGTVLEDHAEQPESPHWEAFARSSASVAMAASAALRPLLKERLQGRRSRVLDVACGSGIYGYSVLLDHPGAELTLLDWPNVLQQARRWGEKMGVDPARVTTVEGDLFEVDYRGPYDAVILSHVYHHFEPAVCVRLSHKVADALAPGGVAVVHDFLSDAGNRAGAMFAVTMLLWTRHGTTYGSAEYARWLADAGLKPTVHHVPGMPTGLILAEKAK
jgi:SAM-dependent methyltransferase